MTARRTRRLLGAAFALGLSAAGLLASAPEAKAYGILPSYTTVSVSANPAALDEPVTLSAEVSVLLKGLHLGPLTPKGTVSFWRLEMIDGQRHHFWLADAPLSSCIILLSKCTATSEPVVLGAQPGAIEDGGFGIVASYDGDALSSWSEGEVYWQVAPSPGG
jgi:hypothetical protein